MSDNIILNLSRRERQIMDVVYMLGEATASQIHAQMPGPVSDASLRKLVRVLEAKGFLSHAKQGREYLYRPTVPREKVRTEAAQHLLKTLFRGITQAQVQKAEGPKESVSNIQTSHEEIGVYDVQPDGGGAPSPGRPQTKAKPVVRTERKIGRNEPCPCGSGKKYKVCCGR